MIHEVPSERANERILQSERGRLIIRELSPNLLLYVEEGFLEAGFAAHILNVLNAMVARGARPQIFVDCERLEGYDPEIQSSATQWIRQNRTRVQIQHMLVRSRITKLGLSLASLTLGGVIKGHTSRIEFETALGRAMGGVAEERSAAAR